MQKLLSLIVLAISVLASHKTQISDLTQAVADRDALLTDMKAKLDAENGEHAALIARAEAAEKETADLKAAGVEVDAKASELAVALNAEPAAPTVDPATFAVTADAPAPADAAPAPDAAPAATA